jgi:hypothetical protein
MDSGCERAEYSKGLCRFHWLDAATRLGKQCPRCHFQRVCGTNGICRYCEQLVLAKNQRARCSSPGCWRAAQMRGLCKTHHTRLPPAQPKRLKRRCSTPGCLNVRAKKGGFCKSCFRAETQRLGEEPSAMYRGAQPQWKWTRDNNPNKKHPPGPPPACRNRCGRLARGWFGERVFCSRCIAYRRRKGRLPPPGPLRIKPGAVCAVPGCGGRQKSSRLCQMHYTRRRRGQRMLKPPKSMLMLREYRGVKRTLNEWAAIFDMSASTLGVRIHRGWTLERALETPVR